MIRRRIAFATLVFCAAIVAVAPRAFSQQSKTGTPLFLWKVTAEGGGEAWLFGSIHAGTKAMYPLPDAIDKAFNSSKKLVVEADIENVDPVALQALVLGKGLYPAGDSLSKHLKPETITLLRAFCMKIGVPFEAMEQTKPWLVWMTVSAMALEDSGLDPELGLDRYFLKAAKAASKDVVEIEGVAQQLELIASFPDADQEANLVAGLSDTTKSKDEISKLVDAWMSGDAARLEAISTASVKEHPETKPVFEKLLHQRNRSMADKVEGYLKTKDTHFVVVGALHLVGDSGIVKLLEARKYKVEQISGR